MPIPNLKQKSEDQDFLFLTGNVLLLVVILNIEEHRATMYFAIIGIVHPKMKISHYILILMPSSGKVFQSIKQCWSFMGKKALQ